MNYENTVDALEILKGSHERRDDIEKRVRVGVQLVGSVIKV